MSLRLETIMACAAAITLALPSLAQTPEPGAAISIPVPDVSSREFREYEVVELAGARPASESLLVDGRLPAAIIDYDSYLTPLRQRLTLFENGVVAVDMRGAGGTIRKRVLLPPDATAAYREFFSAKTLEAFQPHDEGLVERDQAMLRITPPGGEPVERKFRVTAMLPEPIERFRQVLQDVLRALVEDREVTNPITGWVPALGAVLVGDDQRSYRVVRLIQQGEVLELVSTTEPVRRFVAQKDLHLHFIGVRLPRP